MTETFHLELCVPRLLSMWNIWLCLSEFVSICCRGKLLWWWLNKKGLIYVAECLQGSSCCYFYFSFWAVAFFFYPSPWRLVTQAMPHIPTIHWIITPTMHCIVPLLSSIMSHRQDRVVHHRFCSWVGVYISHFVACRILPVPKLLDHGCEVYIGTS